MWGQPNLNNKKRSTNWQLQNSHRDVKYSIGDIVGVKHGLIDLLLFEK